VAHASAGMICGNRSVAVLCTGRFGRGSSRPGRTLAWSAASRGSPALRLWSESARTCNCYADGAAPEALMIRVTE
jgi:hypothetical protein